MKMVVSDRGSERVGALILTLQQQTEDEVWRFKDEKVKAISQVRSTLLLKASSAGTTTVAMGSLYPSLHFENSFMLSFSLDVSFFVVKANPQSSLNYFN